jgi:hypothetical protein
MKRNIPLANTIHELYLCCFAMASKVLKLNYLLSVFLLLIVTGLNAQDSETYSDEDTISCITSEKYKKNPAKYLKYIDGNKIPSGILIDRVKFRSDIALFNGKSKVKTGDYYIWKRLYNSLKYANNDTSNYPSVNLVRKTAVSMIRSVNQMIPIGIIKTQFWLEH